MEKQIDRFLSLQLCGIRIAKKSKKLKKSMQKDASVQLYFFFNFKKEVPILNGPLKTRKKKVG